MLDILIIPKEKYQNLLKTINNIFTKSNWYYWAFPFSLILRPKIWRHATSKNNSSHKDTARAPSPIWYWNHKESQKEKFKLLSKTKIYRSKREWILKVTYYLQMRLIVQKNSLLSVSKWIIIVSQSWDNLCYYIYYMENITSKIVTQTSGSPLMSTWLVPISIHALTTCSPYQRY